MYSLNWLADNVNMVIALLHDHPTAKRGSLELYLSSPVPDEAGQFYGYTQEEAKALVDYAIGFGRVFQHEGFLVPGITDIHEGIFYADNEERFCLSCKRLIRQDQDCCYCCYAESVDSDSRFG